MVERPQGRARFRSEQRRRGRA